MLPMWALACLVTITQCRPPPPRAGCRLKLAELTCDKSSARRLELLAERLH